MKLWGDYNSPVEHVRPPVFCLDFTPSLGPQLQGERAVSVSPNKKKHALHAMQGAGCGLSHIDASLGR